jgi:subtilase family serine protease
MRYAIVPFLLLVACATAAHASPRAHAARDLVTQAVDTTQRAALGRAPAARAKVVGAVAGDAGLRGLTLILRRTPERQAAFESLLAAQQDPSSPDYHRWLTPVEVGERFGASPHDLDAVTGWLRSQGLEIEAVSPARTRIRFGGSAARVAATFATGLEHRGEGKRRRVTTTDPASVPKALAPAIAGLTGLDGARFHPALRVGEVRSQVDGAPRTQASSCNGPTCSYSVFPADFARIYGTETVGFDGSGTSIAIVARQRVSATDVSNFQARAALPANPVQIIVPPGSVDPGDPATGCDGTGEPACDDDTPSDELLDQLEATLDVQRAGSVAPGATIKLIVADDSDTNNGVFEAAEYVVDTTPLPASVLSLSFGSCEGDNGAEIVHAIEGLFTQAAMEGISVMVSSGDSGAADCAPHTDAPPAAQTANINALCSSAAVTCVGGTQFADSANPNAYWSHTNATGFRSALGYIPEGAWNEPLDGTGNPQLAATGGGYSKFVARPYWQYAPGAPSGDKRMTPDISLPASGHDGYFTCMAARGGSCAVSGGSFSYLVMGGTSASAPSMAGIAALLNQQGGVAQGNLNPHLYATASAQPTAFHDATPASSGVACDVAVPSLCNNSTPGPSGLSGGLAGQALTLGYDLATGLGSPDVPALFSAWGSVALSGVPLNQYGLSGSWANPATQSQGLVLSVQPDFYGTGNALVFGGWFTYDTSAAGGQRWYTIQGSASGVAASMPIYLSEGGRFDTPQATTTDSVGIATLHFTDCGRGTLDYTFYDGRGGSIPLTRLLANIECSQAGGTSTTNASYRLSGIWADPGNDGQGLVVDVDPLQHVLFAAWYTYTANAPIGSDERQQRWYTLQASLASGATQASNFGIFTSTGGVFDHAATTSTVQVGSASIVLHGCSSATLSYHFTSGSNAGKSGTLDLARIGNPPAACP